MLDKIKPIDILDDPRSVYRIEPILDEFKNIWFKYPHLTFSQLLLRIVEKEYEKEYITVIQDDELLAAIQRYI